MGRSELLSGCRPEVLLLAFLGCLAGTVVGILPLFGLGIPTGPPMALIMAALMVYGVVPGATMFTSSSDITAAVIASFFVANVILLVLNLPLAPLWATIAKVPYGVLGPVDHRDLAGVLAAQSPFLLFTAAALVSVGAAVRMHRRGVDTVDANA